MVALPLAFAASNTAGTGVRVASQVATTTAQPSGSFFGELGGVISSGAQTAISTFGDILRLKAEAERARAVQKAQERLVPGQVPTAQQQGLPFLPTQFRPVGSAGANGGGNLVPMILLGGAGLLLLAVVLRKV